MTSARAVLRGSRIVLRPPAPRDKRDRLAYGRDPEFRRMVGGDHRVVPPLSADEVDRWYEEIAEDGLRWIIDLDGRCIGTARLHDLDETNRSAAYSIGIFDRACWNQGYGTEATRLVLRHAFEESWLHRVSLRVLAFNERAIACYLRCGFVREGIAREDAFIAGEWQSDVLMSILEHEY